MSEKVICSSCERENSEEAVYCMHCSKELLFRCPECNEFEWKGRKYCKKKIGRILNEWEYFKKLVPDYFGRLFSFLFLFFIILVVLVVISLSVQIGKPFSVADLRSFVQVIYTTILPLSIFFLFILLFGGISLVKILKKKKKKKRINDFFVFHPEYKEILKEEGILKK